MLWRRGVLLSLSFAFLSSTTVFARPKVISLDYCADQYVLALADRTQIIALSEEADYFHSFYRDRATGIDKVRPSIEEILPRQPDIVVRHWAGRPRLLAMLERSNIPTVTAGFGTHVETVYANLSLFGDALDRQQEAKTLQADLEERLRALRAAPRSDLIAAYVTPGGVTAGQETFIDAIIREAGFRSSAEHIGLTGWAQLPLENYVMDPPDIIIGSFFDMPSDRSSNWSAARHARVRKMLKEIPTIYVPGAYLSCNGLFYVDAAEYIRNEASERQLFSATPRELGS